MKKFVKLNKYLLLTVLIVCSILSLVYALTFIDKLQSDFDKGIYVNTSYNASVGAVQLNLSYGNGTYTSQIFNTGSNVSLNNLSWTFQRIQCPANMSYINKLNGYCIDQYEASMPSANSTAMGNPTNVTNRNAPGSMAAISQSGVVPWVGISANSARTACTNAGKHLCTSEEWLAGANINGAFYDLPTGAATASVIPSGASDSTGCNTYEAADCDGMSMNSNYVIGTGGDACNTGNKTSCKSAEGVYDMVGNVWEWTNDTVNYVKPCTPGTSGYCYWNGTGWGTSGTAKYGNDGVYFLDTSVARSGYAVVRGGDWSNGAVAGPFCAHLDSAPTASYFILGFRCCSS
jgi:formylglycine-generating enzyme required for sulfatase activity